MAKFVLLLHSLIFIIFPVSIALIIDSNKAYLEAYCIALCTGPMLYAYTGIGKF